MSEVSRRMPSDYERRSQATEAQMRAQGQPPLLLKPNGAPVFQDCGTGGALAGSLQKTMPRTNCAAAADSMERTVKAHSFVLGKAIANQTSLAVFDMAKDSSAQDQSFPVKVIYVKPGLAKHKSLKAAAAREGELGKENTQTGNVVDRNADQQLRDDVSLGEISGIFKKQRALLSKRGSKSAPLKEAEAKAKKQKEYAEQVRKEAKAKQLARQASQPVATKESEQVEESVQADDHLLRVPHAQNRFKGEFKSLTKELFQKAQAKVRDDKLTAKMAEQGLKAQKELEKRYQEEIKLRNQEIINEQRQRGTRGPTLLEKEEAKKRQQFSSEIHEKMQQRRQKKIQREQDHAARMGLALQDKKKKREFELRKQKRLEEEQAAQRLVEEQNRQKLLLRDKNLLNKDLIDFTDPNAIPGERREEQQRQDGLADEAAEPVVDRKAILREQKLKRKQQELEKQREQEEERQMKDRRMHQLELHLKQQRDEISRRQAQMLEKETRKARSIQPKIYNQAGDKRPKSDNHKKDRSKQLNELRGWIEEQMHLEDFQSPADQSAADMGQSASKTKAKSTLSTDALLDFANPNLVGHQLPGNNMLPLEDERKVMARDNRYGLHGDNGYDDIVKEQRIKEGWKSPGSQNQNENVLDFTQKEASPQKSDDSYDYQPVKEEKRKIVNQAAADLDIPSRVPGVINIQDEAARQQAEEKRRTTEAAVVMQKWARGWQDRKRTRRLRSRMKKEIDYAHDEFTQQFKLNDEFNIQRFYNEKQRLRKLNQTENVDEESISEMIGESQSYKDIDLVQESYIQSHILASQSGATANARGAPQTQNFFGQAPKAGDTDPLSLISIFAKRNTLAASPEQMIPEKEKPGSSPKPDKRAHKVMDYVEKRRESRRRDSKPKQTKKQKKPSYIDDEIEEDIIQSSKDKQDDEYSSEFVSEHIEADSIPSYRGSPLKQSRQDSSVIEESIQESIAASKEKKPSIIYPSRANKMQSSGTQESIQEDLKKSQSIQSATIEDEIAESKGLDDGSDEISEESYLKGSGDFEPASSFKRPAQPINTFKPKPALPNKVERIRENIEDDYENDGFESLHGSLKADKLKEMQVQAKKEDAEKYRMSKDIIQDFEENKGLGTVQNKRLMNDLAEELKRYEAAVNGSIFVEQFQGIVQKSLAQKDVLMLGQRLSQLEQENKHKQEIADIREEQIRMMSQLMLLNASSGNVDKQSGDQIKNQQAEIMHNIQKLIEKPIIIQGDIEASVASHQSHVNVLESVGSRLSNAKPGGAAQKFTSVEQSNNIAEDLDEAADSEDEIEDEIESDIQGAKSGESDSIKESIEQSRQSEKKLQNARRMLGSEQSIIDKSKNMLSDKSKRASSVFEKNTFQNYTNNKFKDLLTNESSAMEHYLDNIEKAVTKKSDEEAKQLKKQLDQRKISPRTFKKKASQLEKWYTGERAEINSKRAKVRDTCSDIGHFMKKLEKDKLMMLDQLPSGQSTPRGLRRSASNISGASDSEGLQAVQEQLRELKSGQIGGEKPETKYLNKKREFVRQLMKEKKDAVERGVKDKMKNLESEMIDDMLYHALNLDVDKEVETRIEIARKMVEDGRIEESASKSAGPYRDGHSKTSASKKNVTFQSPQNEKYSSSQNSHSQQHQASSLSRSMNEKHPHGGHEVNDDMIGESIQIDETQSYQPSHSASASKASMSQSRRSNAQLKESAGKHSRKSNQDSDHKPSVQNVDDEDEDSLERDEDEIQESYSNEFIEESIASASLSEKTNLKSKQALQSKAADIEESGYSEAFEESSIGQSQSTNLRNKLANSQQNKDIEIVNEEDDNLDSSAPASQSASRRSKTSSKRSPHQQAQKESTPRDLPAESFSDLEDREILESTQSVDWQIVLQERAKKASIDQQSPLGSSGQGGSGDLDGEQVSEVQDEVELKAQDNLADLDSCPSGSMGASNEADHELKVDQITDDLLESILRDFKQDSSVKMVVEDDVDEDDFEDYWPYSLDKKVPEPEPVNHVPQALASPSAEVDPTAQQESDAKKKHDEQMQKYHAEQKIIQEQQQKVEEYLDFIINVVDKEVIQAALQKPIEHDPLKVLEKIQAFDTEDEIELTNLGYSQQQSALSPELFDEIERRFDELKAEASAPSDKDENKNDVSSADGARTYLHLAIFDAFNDALDQGRPYQFKGLPNPWSRQTRVTNETLSTSQVDTIIRKAKDRVMEWQKTGAGTRFAPPPPPPPLQGEYDPPQPPPGQDSEEERNKAERQERLGLLLTKEVHQREQDWLDYEIEDTQVRFDLADMILEELADEATQFLLEKAGGSLPASLENY